MSDRMRATLAMTVVACIFGLVSIMHWRWSYVGPKAELEFMSDTFANTTLAAMPTGSASFYFNQDHTFTAAWPGGLDVRGRWRITGRRLCLVWSSPPPATGPESCVPLHRHKLGTSTEVDGTIVSVRAGRP